MLALNIRNLNKKYPDFELKDVSFQLEKGYIMGFIGANGAGKTTTIKSILNMIQMDSGEISVFGKNITEHETELKQEIGCAFGDIDFYTRSKIKTLTNITKRFYKNWNDETYYNYLKRFRLDENKKIAELSTGMNLEKCADYITFIDHGQIIASSEKYDFMESYRLLSGSESQLHDVKEQLISYKVNSFGFTGLIHAKDFDPSSNLKATTPSLEEIMIYFAKREGMYV